MGTERVVSLGEPFRPPDTLVEAVKKGRVPPRREMVELLKQRQKEGHEIEVEELAERITLLSENLFANRARRAAASCQNKVGLTVRGELATDICRDLVEGLALDPARAQDVLCRFHSEWSAFARIPKERWWGRLRADDSGLFLDVNIDRASQADDFEAANAEHGTVTE